MPPHRIGPANRGLPGACVGLRRPQLVIICIGRRIRLIVAMSQVSSFRGGSAVPVPETALSWNGCIPHVVPSEAWWVCTVSRIRKATKNQIKTEKGRFLQCRRGCVQLARRESWDFSCTGMPALRGRCPNRGAAANALSKGGYFNAWDPGSGTLQIYPLRREIAYLFLLRAPGRVDCSPPNTPSIREDTRKNYARMRS